MGRHGKGARRKARSSRIVTVAGARGKARAEWLAAPIKSNADWLEDKGLVQAREREERASLYAKPEPENLALNAKKNRTVEQTLQAIINRGKLRVKAKETK